MSSERLQAFDESAGLAEALALGDGSERFMTTSNRLCAAIKQLNPQHLPEDRRRTLEVLREAICLPTRRQNDASFRRAVRDTRKLLSCYFDGVKRSPELMRKLLQGLGKDDIDLRDFSEQEIEFNLRHLLQEGLATGRRINNGLFVSSVELDSVTPAGAEFLKQMDANEITPEMLVFISHSSKDLTTAAALVDLLLAGFDMEPNSILCTSLDGHRPPVGVTTDAFLQNALQQSRAFIGLLTPNSLNSTYVLFELGARWGARSHLAPVVAGGLAARDLGSPLSALTVLSLAEEPQVYQLIDDLGTTLGVHKRPPTAYSRRVRTLSEVARQPN